MSQDTVTIYLQNSTKYAVRLRDTELQLSENVIEPTDIPAFTLGAPAKFETEDPRWGVIVVYESPDPSFDFAVLFAHVRRSRNVEGNIVKTGFFPTGTKHTGSYIRMLSSPLYTDSNSHRYTAGDGKQYKINVWGYIGQGENQEAGFTLQHYVWEKKV